ncbi:DUF6305 family protein [Fusibacter sp. JL298sf-3]
MNNRLFFIIILIISVYILVLSAQTASSEMLDTIPSLPQPIGEETVLITSAGQSMDTYIVKDMANELLIHNYFMPTATEADLTKTQSVIVVVGYSHTSDKLNTFTAEEEIDRVRALIKSAKSGGQSITTVFIGGKNRRGTETDAMLSALLPISDYIITTVDGDEDRFLYTLAQEAGRPITRCDDVKNVSEPLASIFR